MSTRCSCGEAELDASGFAFADHRLHGAAACARHRTFGEVIRLVADGAGTLDAIADALGSDIDRALLGHAVAMLVDMSILQSAQKDKSHVSLAPGLASIVDAEKMLVHAGSLHPGDYAV